MSRDGERLHGVLILGDGFLGGYMRARLGAVPTLAVRRTAVPAAAHAANCTHSACDILDAAIENTLGEVLRRFSGAVFFLLPPSAFAERDPARALAPLLHALEAGDITRVVVASSSGVYAANAAAPTAVDGPLDHGSPRAQRLLAIERAWLASDFDVRVVRFGGLYGAGRVIGRSSVVAGELLPGSGEDWLNLVHGADAARALLGAASANYAQRILLISDGRALRRAEYYGQLAHLLNLPPPRFDAGTARRGGSRRLDPGPSWHALGLEPEHVDINQELSLLLARSRSDDLTRE